MGGMGGGGMGGMGGMGDMMYCAPRARWNEKPRFGGAFSLCRKP